MIVVHKHPYLVVSSPPSPDPLVLVATDAVVVERVEPASSSLFGAGQAEIGPVLDVSNLELAGHDRETHAFHVDALPDDGRLENVAALIVGLEDLRKALPLICGHPNSDQEVPVLAVILHHSLVLDLPLTSIVEEPFPVFNETDRASIEADVRLVSVSPSDVIIVLRAKVRRIEIRSVIFLIRSVIFLVRSGIFLIRSGLVRSVLVRSVLVRSILVRSRVAITAAIWLISKKREMHGIVLIVLVGDGDGAIRSPHRDGPVSADLRVGEVELNNDVDGIVRGEDEWRELVITLAEDSEVVVMRSLDAVIFASVVPEGVAGVAHAAAVPSVCSHPDLLLNIGGERQSVLGACRTAVEEITWVVSLRLVIQHQEVGAVPVGHIVGEVSPSEGCEVETEGHEEDSIIVISVAHSILIFLTDVIPLRARIAPCCRVEFRGPRVAHLDESVVANRLDAEDSVGVTLDQTASILVVVIVAGSVHLNHVLRVVFAFEQVPDCIFIIILVGMRIVRSSAQSSCGSS